MKIGTKIDGEENEKEEMKYESEFLEEIKMKYLAMLIINIMLLMIEAWFFKSDNFKYSVR